MPILKKSVFGKTWPILSMLLLMSHLLCAQIIESSEPHSFEQDTSRANQWIKIAKSFLDSIQYDSAIRYYQQAIDTYAPYLSENEDTLLWESYIHCKNRIGNCYARLVAYEKGLSIFNANLKLAKKYLGENHSEVDYAYMGLGIIYKNQGFFKKALAFYQKALPIQYIVFGEKHPRVADTHITIGNVSINQGLFEEALKNYQKALTIQLDYYGESAQDQTIATSYIGIGTAYFYQSKYKEAMVYFEKALTIQKIVLGEKHFHTGVSHSWMGNVYGTLGLYEKALESNQKALRIFQLSLNENHPNIGVVLNNIGNLFGSLGEFEKAEEYLRKDLAILIATVGENHPDVAGNYNNLGGVFENREKYEEALQMHQKALDIKRKILRENHPDIGLSYDNLGVAYEKLGNNKEALNNYEKALAINLIALGKNHPQCSKSYFNIGTVQGIQGNYDLSLENHKKALDIRVGAYGNNHPNVAESFNRIGMIYQELGDFEKAIDNFQEAIWANTPDSKKLETDASEIVGIEVYSDLVLSETLLQRAKTLSLLNSHQPEGLGNYYSSRQTYEQATQLIDLMRQKLHRNADKEELLKKALDIYQGAIQTNLELYQQTQQDSFLQQAFVYSEKSRATLLLEDLSNTQAKSFAGIPDSLLEQEKEVEALLSTYEQNLFLETQKKNQADSTTIFFLRNKIFLLKQQADSINAVFEKEFPNYYRLKYDVDVVAVQEIQHSMVDDETSLIEYFIGDSSIYAFFISKNTYDLIKLPNDFPLHQWVNRLQSSIYTWYLTGQESEETYQAYTDTFATTAHQLYQKLLAPIVEKYPLSSRLIIVPDGVLGYVPFEILLKEKPRNPTQFANHNYLIKDHQISYCYSATLLQEMKEKQHQRKPNDQLLAFAPSFGNYPMLASSRQVEEVRRGLGALRFNIPEAQAICDLLGGRAILGADATEANFTSLAPQYSILHLATHGKANDRAGEYSFLAFANIPDSVENEFLYTRDLYNLQLNADMVVLSACETGIGELQRGEGIVSLARGFSYAGAKSILTSLWNINDATTSELMKSFYTYIDGGMSKDAALRQAKLDYLQSHPNEEVHPFYWAAMIAMGDMAPIDVQKTFVAWWIWLLLGLGIMVVGGYLYKKKKNHLE